MHVFVYVICLSATVDAARLRAGNAHHGRHGGRGGDNADGNMEDTLRITGSSQARMMASLDEVITLLGQMITEFNTAATEDKENWENYQKWSDESEAEKNTFINDQNALIMAAQAKESANKQNVQKLVEDLGKLASDIAATEGSLKELMRMRAEERASFEAALADITKTITAVDKATEILEGHYSADKATLAEIRTRVQMALSTSGLHISTNAEQSVENLASLLQSTVSGRRAPDYLSVDGAASYGKYESQAGGHGVMGMLSDLRAQLETQRQEMVQKENESQRQFEETKAAKDADLAAARKQVAEKTETQAKCEAIIEGSIATANQASKDIDDANAFLTQLLADRETFTKQFAERTSMRKQEEAATQAALDALQSVSVGAKAGVGAGASFIQLSQSASRNEMDSNAAKKVIHVMTKLIELGKELHSTALVRVATELKQKVDSKSTHQQKVDSKNQHQQKGFYDASDFGPVMKLLSDLIARLEEEANAETSQHEWCETEKSQGVASQQERERNIHSLKGTIESLTTMIAQLKTEVTFMESEIVRVTGETKEAKAIRAQEHTVFVQAKKDHEEVIAALQAAIRAMTGQYGFIQSFVQVNSARQSPFGSYASGAGSAGSAMEMLEDLLGRYSEALTGLITDEEAAQKLHDELVARNDQFLMDTTASKNSKIAERRRSINELAADKEDMKTNLLELHDVSKYLQDLRPSCDDIRSTYEERKKRREAEIGALKEALQVLSDPSMMA